MCAAGRSIGDPRLSPDGRSVAFVAGGSAGAAVVVVAVDGGPELRITTDPAPSGSAPAGRGVFDWTPDGRGFIYAAARGGLYHQPAEGGPARRLAGVADGATGPAVSPDGTRVAYIAEGRDVAVAWTGLDGPWPVRLSAHPDFCVDAAWAPDGRTVVWHEWDVPAMAWDHSRVASARAPDADGAMQPEPAAVLVAGPAVTAAKGTGAVAQPRYCPDGALIGFLSDASGWLNLWVAQADGSDPRPVVAEDHEHGGPTWGGGQRSWVWAPDGKRVALCRNEGGFGRLVVFELATAEATTIDRGVFGGLSWMGDHLVAVRSGAATPDQVVAYDVGDPPAGSETSPPHSARHRRSLARGPVAGFDAPGAVEPRLVQWDGEDRPEIGRVVHGRLSVAPGGRPGVPNPLLVWIHGGPTGQNQVTFNARVAYFTDRGWNVLQADPRGSTGWGRAYAQGLRHEWGRLDIGDIAAGIRAAFASAWGDPARTAIIGGSSGGLAVVGVLAHHPELCAAGVDLYGVSDLIELDDTTHRFEAHYLQSLLGPRPDHDARYRERSPLHLAERIRVPLLVLHGSADRVVTQGQSDALVESLRSRRAPVEYHVYDGEGHGWSHPETVGDEITRIDDFLTRHVLRLPRRPIS